MAQPERGPVANYINPASLGGRGFVVLGAGPGHRTPDRPRARAGRRARLVRRP